MRVSTKELACLAFLLLPAFSPAEAALTISSAPMINVTCAKAICTATAADAVLNVNRLQRMLAIENPKVVSGSVAGDIVVATAISWPSAHTLTLDSYRSVVVNKPVAVTGTGGLTILTNDGGGPGGSFSFGSGANIAFWDLSSKLTIDGWPYTLVDDWTTFVQAEEACDNSLHIALTAGINAGANTYYVAPIQNACGTIEGLGNAISNLTIVAGSPGALFGLFGEANGSIENLTLANVQITGFAQSVGALAAVNGGSVAGISVSGSILMRGDKKYGGWIGALVGGNSGTIINSHSSAAVQGAGEIGGLAAENSGSIRNSSATGAVHGNQIGIAGGLVAINLGAIDGSYATGSVASQQAGGLVGENVASGNAIGKITNSYATGGVKFPSTVTSSLAGGLVAKNSSTVNSSYSTGRVSRVVSGSNDLVGGLIGEDDSPSGDITNAYWDITSSRTKTAVGLGSASGITGLTTIQLQSGLPAGFDPSVWGESPSINGGLPYLLGNPPT